MKIKKNISEIPEFFRKYLKLYLQHLKKRINENLLSLILYGSVARDIWNEESDVDLFLILSNELKKKILILIYLNSL
ncbi:MAG: nucleotidyltransferase domain-containing protein [Promethearchaeati archaeon]